MDDVKYINVDETKLDQMQQYCLCSLEQPIIAIPLDFKAPGSTSYTSGYLMITCGALYLFKGKAFGHVALITKFNIFQVNVIHFSSDQVIFDFSDFGMMNFSSNSELSTKSSSSTLDNTSISNNSMSSISNSLVFLKTTDAFIIVQASLYIQKFISYGVKNAHLSRLDSTSNIKEVEINSRPQDALTYRTIFFSHYYCHDAKEVLNIDFFKKWDQKRLPYIVIGSILQPGQFSRAFGHSLAWEPMLKTVCFRSFCPSSFPDFFDSLVTNSTSSVSEIQFGEYKDSTQLPVFSGRHLKCDNCSIKRYIFREVNGTFLLSFFEKCKRIPKIEGLVLSQVKMDATEFTQFCNCVLHNKPMQDTLKKFLFERSKIPSFPTNDMKIMLGCLTHLESISLRDFNCDGVRLINAICKSNAPVRVIHANRLRFQKSFEKVTFPESLIHLDVSLSLFSDEAISSLLVSITRKPKKIPIIFTAVRIILKKSSYPAIGKIQFEKCYPTISEFNFSFNRIPAIGSRSLFAFLFTQKNLRNLTLNNIGATDSVKLLKNIMMIILSMKIPGFSFAPASEKVLAVLNSLHNRKQEQKQADVNKAASGPIPQQQSNNVDEDNSVDDLLSFDFEPTAKTVHSSNFAEDLYLLDFGQNDQIAPQKKEEPKVQKKSTTPKDPNKPPPTVTGFEPPTIIQFIQALVQQNATFLRRFILVDSKIGDKGIQPLIQLIQISPNLNEVCIDGIEPENLNGFLMLWKTISGHPSIVACEYPSQDVKKLQIDVDKAQPEVKEIFEKIKKMANPSSTSKRVKLTEKVENTQNERVVFNGDIFEKCASFNLKKESKEYDNEYDDDEENNGNINDNGVWKNSQIGDGKETDDLLVFENFD